MPPTLDLFLRHLYRVSTQWHGALRNESIRTYKNSSEFNFNYYRTIRQKPFEMKVVQNIFINFGIMMIILSLIWIVALILYFLFLRIKKTKVNKPENDTNLKNQGKSKSPVKLQIDQTGKTSAQDEILYSSVTYPSFLKRLALSFAFLIAATLSLSFTVEIMFYIFFEFHNSQPKHVLFKVSLACAVVIFIIHLILILYVLAYPFLFLKKLRVNAPKPPAKDVPNYQDALKLHKQKILAFNAKYPDITFLNSSPTKAEHAPFCWLFVLQGLKLTFIRPYFMGLTSLLYVFYSMFLALIPVPPHVAVILNFLIVTLLFGYMLLFPLVNLLENIFLIAGYFFFWLGYLLLLILSVGVESPVSRCHLALAIASLFFLGWLILFFGFLYSLFNFCRYNFGKKAAYTSQVVHTGANMKNGIDNRTKVRTDKNTGIYLLYVLNLSPNPK
jgi:heme/copper-type cytochrome/quinol oxidase subunit 2